MNNYEVFRNELPYPPEELPNHRTPTFTCFPNLPTELRLLIWDHALPDERDVALGIPAVELPNRDTVVNEKIMPEILHVCRESREYTLKIYEIIPTHHVPNYTVARRIPRNGSLVQNGLIYCAPTRDMFNLVLVENIDLYALRMPDLKVARRNNPKFLSRVRVLAVHLLELRDPEAMFATKFWWYLMLTLDEMSDLRIIFFEFTDVQDRAWSTSSLIPVLRRMERLNSRFDKRRSKRYMFTLPKWYVYVIPTNNGL